MTDLRTEKIDSKSAEIQVEKTKERKDFNLAYKKQNENTVQFTMDFSNSVNQNITASDTQSAAANGSTFQNMLSNSLSILQTILLLSFFTSKSLKIIINQFYYFAHTFFTVRTS